MSSATTGNFIPASDAPPVFGTPEHQAYYYDKIEKSMYRYIENCVEMLVYYFFENCTVDLPP